MISTPLIKPIEPDWFFHNPTRANVGSIGRVPATEPHALTSPEYQVWRIRDGSLLPAYVEILVKTAFFNSMVQVHRVGAVKQRLFARNLMAIPVPVVKLEAQAAIVARWQELQDHATELERLAETVEAKTQEKFLAELGATSSATAKRRKAIAVRWESVDRWAVSSNQLEGLALRLGHARYPVRLLGEVAAVSYGIAKSPINRPSQSARPSSVAAEHRANIELERRP